MKQKPRILVIDDDVDLVAVMIGTLESKAYDVIVAYNGKDGLEKAKKEKAQRREEKKGKTEE